MEVRKCHLFFQGAQKQYPSNPLARYLLRTRCC